MTLDLVPRVRFFAHEMRRDRARNLVAVMGDSMVFTEGPGTPMPEWMKRELVSVQGSSHVTGVHVLNWPAWSAAPEYCMVDEVARTKPDLLVLELNLRLLGPAAPGAFSYPELAGHVANARLAEAALLPLSYSGITLSRLLFYRAIVLSKHEQHFSAVLERQARLFKAREPLEQWLDGETKSNEYADRRWAWGIALSVRQLAQGTARSRDNKPHALAMLGDVIDGLGESHPRLVVLDAMIRDFEARGIPVLVWASPIDLQHLGTLGLPTDGIERSMRTIRRMIERSGAHFVDLHALLPDAAFIDAGDHYTRDGYPNGAQAVGQALARAIDLEEKRLALQ
jgi:hypothetical protein